MAGRSTPRATAREVGARLMSEKQWQALVLSFAAAHGWWAYHPFDSRRSSSGWPDLTLVRGGELVFMELKKHNGKVSDDQARVITMLEEAGQEVHVCRPQDEAAVFERLARPRQGARRHPSLEYGGFPTTVPVIR